MDSNWLKVREQRDNKNNLTDLALAVDAIEQFGCDCGIDEQGTCIACICEQTLHRFRKNISKVMDALCLKGHDATKEWKDLCILCGRYTEPFLSYSPRFSILPQECPRCEGDQYLQPCNYCHKGE